MITHKQDTVKSNHNHSPTNHASHDDAHGHDMHGQNAHQDAHIHSGSHSKHGEHDAHGDAGGHGEHGGHDAHGDAGGHNEHGGHDAHGHAGGHDVHGGHDAHGHAGGHSAHGGHDAHGHAGGHSAHGGHDAHGHAGGHGGSKVPQMVGLGTIFGLLILLGIPTLFNEFDRFFGDQAVIENNTGVGIMSSYMVSNARWLRSVEVTDVQHTTMETPKATASIVYVHLATGERFMAMDMTGFRSLGVSEAAIQKSKAAYRKAKNLRVGLVNLQVTGDPPIEFILTGVESLIVDIEGP